MKIAAIFVVSFGLVFLGLIRINFAANDQIRAIVYETCPAGGKALPSENFAIAIGVDAVKSQPIWKRVGFCVVTMWK